jgi:hypothetical protein
MLAADGVTVTAGVVFEMGGVVVPPPPQAVIHRLSPIPIQAAAIHRKLFISMLPKPLKDRLSPSLIATQNTHNEVPLFSTILVQEVHQAASKVRMIAADTKLSCSGYSFTMNHLYHYPLYFQ